MRASSNARSCACAFASRCVSLAFCGSQSVAPLASTTRQWTCRLHLHQERGHPTPCRCCFHPPHPHQTIHLLTTPRRFPLPPIQKAWGARRPRAPPDAVPAGLLAAPARPPRGRRGAEAAACRQALLVTRRATVARCPPAPSLPASVTRLARHAQPPPCAFNCTSIYRQIWQDSGALNARA